MAKSISQLIPYLKASSGAKLVPWDLTPAQVPVNPVYDDDFVFFTGFSSNGYVTDHTVTVVSTTTQDNAKGDLGVIPASGKIALYLSSAESLAGEVLSKAAIFAISEDVENPVASGKLFLLYLAGGQGGGLEFQELVGGYPSVQTVDGAYTVGQPLVLNIDIDDGSFIVTTPNGTFGPFNYSLPIAGWGAMVLTFISGATAGDTLSISATTENDLGSGLTPETDYVLYTTEASEGALPSPLPDNGSILYCTAPGKWRGKEYAASVGDKIDGAILVDGQTGEVIPLSETSVIDIINKGIQAAVKAKPAHVIDYSTYDYNDPPKVSLSDGLNIVVTNVNYADPGPLDEVILDVDVGTDIGNQSFVFDVIYSGYSGFPKTKIKIRAIYAGGPATNFIVDEITKQTAYTFMVAPGSLTYLLNKWEGHASNILDVAHDPRLAEPFPKNSMIQQLWPRPNAVSYGWHLLNQDLNTRRALQDGSGSFPEVLSFVTDNKGKNYAALTATNVLVSFRGIGAQNPTGIPITDASKVKMAFSPNGKYFIVANTTANKIEVYDTEADSTAPPVHAQDLDGPEGLVGDVLDLTFDSTINGNLIVIGNFTLGDATPSIRGIKFTGAYDGYDGEPPYDIEGRTTGYNITGIQCLGTTAVIVGDDGAGNNVVLSGALSRGSVTPFGVTLSTTDIIHDAKHAATEFLGGQDHIMILLEEVATGNARLLRKNQTGSTTYGDILIEEAAPGKHTSFVFSKDGYYIAMPSGVLVDNITMEVLTNHRVGVGALAFF